MITFLADTALYSDLSKHYKDTQKKGGMILKKIFTSDADMIPDYEQAVNNKIAFLIDAAVKRGCKNYAPL